MVVQAINVPKNFESW